MTHPARQGEGQLSDAIREALAHEPGLLLFRNARCAVRKSNRMVRGGLGDNGSADLVGVLTWRANADSPSTGRFVAIEIKIPGQIPSADDVLALVTKLASPGSALWRLGRRAEALRRPLHPADRHVLEQEAWMLDVRERGGFAAYVDSVQGAREAIARARRGASQ